jgi:hypothetical protein
MSNWYQGACWPNLVLADAALSGCSLQQLVNSIYPAQQAAAAAAVHAGSGQQQQQQQGAPTATPSEGKLQQQQQQQEQLEQLQHRMYKLHLLSSTDICNSICYRTTLLQAPSYDRSSSSSSSSSSSCLPVEAAAVAQVQRQADVSAALLLYFVCVPRQPIMQELVKQLKTAAHCCLGPGSNSSRRSSSQLSQCGKADLTEMLLLQHPTYQLAVQAAAAYSNCHWVQFMRCYEQQPPLLMRVVMECALQRLRVHAVHSAVTAYRMLPSSVLLRWLGLQSEQQDAAQKAAADSLSSREIENVLRKQLVGVLLKAGEGGCKGARLAAEQCMMSDEALPETLQFRG